jgi:transcriptional regulator of arginine metabolism
MRMPKDVEGWEKRQKAVEEILRKEPVRNQEDLRRKLRARGFRVTQASVSRDLQDLGAAKVEGRYLPAAALSAGASPSTRLEEVSGFLVSTVAAGPHLLVLKTPPGLASSFALALDGSGWPEVLGTVAGDDTFFIATAGRAQQARLEAKLAGLRKGATRHA